MPASNNQETIDSRILRLIGLEDIFDLDYETYLTLLKEAMVKGRMPKTSIPTEEVELLTDEYKRVKSKKDSGRFKVNKKKITTGSFSVGKVKGLITASKSKGVLSSAQEIAKSPLSSSLEEGISKILDSITSILDTLNQQKKLTENLASYERRKKEQDKRAGEEGKLEKGFSALKKVAEKVLSPVKSILDRILQFFTNIILGRVVVKLIEWFADPKNADKVKSIFRFLKDHWPKLLSLYLVFGTSFGRFARGLISLVVKGTAGLVKATVGLAAKVIGGKLGGKLGKVSKFLGGGKGKLLVAGIEAAATIGGTLALSKGLENFGGLGGGEKDQKVQGRAGGGHVTKIPGFSGGGFNFKNMFGGSSLGSMFGPLGMLLGGGANNGESKQGGYVSGEKGVDKIPAMLSDGEFVMSRGAVQKYGVSALESMNAAGGGTNKPRMISGVPHASGGGMIGNASNLIKKEEALSSLSTKGNDYVIPGGKSVLSGMKWGDIKPQTKIHAYFDSKGIPTIGWGATFYDKLTSGTKPVKMGDVITKSKADSILNTQILDLANTYSKKIKYWSKMSDTQKAAIVSIGFNAGPNAPLGSYPKLSAALASGNMKGVAANVTRDGPSQERLNHERKLLLTGPHDLTKVSSKPESKPQQQNREKSSFMDKISSTLGGLFSSPARAEGKSRKYNTGGLVHGRSGQDKISASLSKGEYVSTVGAVQRHGIDTFNKLNSPSYKSSIKQSKPSLGPITPPVRRSPRVSYNPPSSFASGGMGASGFVDGSGVPKFSASVPGGNYKKKTLGIVV